MMTMPPLPPLPDEDDGQDGLIKRALIAYAKEYAAAVRASTIEEAISVIPGGDICDPQQIADAIRALK